MGSSNAATPQARALAGHLEAAVTEAGLSDRALAKLMGMSHMTIGRWRRGENTPDPETVATLLAHCGVTGERRDEILALARNAGEPNWLAPGVGRQLAALTEYERTATSIISVQPNLIPGVLQTFNYARSLMINGGASEGEATHSATYRMGRRDMLTRQSKVPYLVVLGEQAVRYPACAKEIAAEQLRHLLALAKDVEALTVQIVPLAIGYSPIDEGAFMLIESGNSAVVHLERFRSSALLTDAGDVAAYKDAADTLRRDAMSPADTTRLIAEIADEMESTS